MKYTAEEVRAAINLFAGYSCTHHDIGAELMDIARAFAERIEADERAVPVAQIDQIGLDLLADGTDARCCPADPAMAGCVPLFTRPPAQAAHVDETCPHEAWEENGGWCKCTDCGHGWRKDAEPVARVIVADNRQEAKAA